MYGIGEGGGGGGVGVKAITRTASAVKKIRSRQDLNLRSQRESDFESDALTARPRLLYTSVQWNETLNPKIRIRNYVKKLSIELK